MKFSEVFRSFPLLPLPMNARDGHSRWHGLRLSTVALAAVSITAPTVIAASAMTEPVGVTRRDFAVGMAGVGTPLVDEELYVGEVASNSLDALTLVQQGFDVGAVLADAQPYYVEILTGAFEGERVDVDVDATKNVGPLSMIVLNVASGRSTVSGFPVDSLSNIRICIRKHITLARLKTLFQPVLSGNINLSLADQVFLLEGGAWRQYTLFIDNNTWLKAGAPGDFRNQVIPPGVGVLVRLGSVPKTFVQPGKVRLNSFRLNLAAGFQSFSPPFPVDLSPVEIGASVDAELPLDQRWFSSSNLDQADSIYPLENGAFVRHTLFVDGQTWLRIGSPGNFANVKILSFSDTSLIKRANPDTNYEILRPFPL